MSVPVYIAIISYEDDPGDITYLAVTEAEYRWLTSDNQQQTPPVANGSLLAKLLTETRADTSHLVAMPRSIFEAIVQQGTDYPGYGVLRDLEEMFGIDSSLFGDFEQAKHVVPGKGTNQELHQFILGDMEYPVIGGKLAKPVNSIFQIRAATPEQFHEFLRLNDLQVAGTITLAISEIDVSFAHSS